MNITEAVIAVVLAANVISTGNLYLIGARPFSDPVKIQMGPDYDNGLYVAVQERPQGLWAVIETWKHPPAGRPVAEGYGAYPLRLWGSNFLAETNGVVVVPNTLVTPKIVLQETARSPGGGVTWNPNDLGTYLTRDGPDAVLFVDGKEVWRKGGDTNAKG